MFSLLAALAATPGLLQAPKTDGQEPKNGLAFSTELKTLVVFKEGFGFYVREGKAKLEDGWATTNMVPRALRGTLWIYPTAEKDRVDTIVLTQDNRIDFAKPEAIKTALDDKIGLTFTIQTEGRSVTGELKSLLSDMLLLKDGSKNYIALEYAKIDAITLVNYPVRVKLATDKPNATAGIGMAYIQEGIRWEPSYMLELLPNKQGRLTLRGTLLNLDEELKDTDVVFVVGAPLIANRGQMDTLLALVAPGGPGGGGRGGGFGQGGFAAESNRPGVAFKSADANDMSGFAGALPSAESGELHYYTKPKMRLRVGDRAMATIFEATIPVTTSFEWNADGEDVYYLLNLKNTSKQPFTTGSVFVVENQRPVGQQLVKYTPSGGSAELRLAAGIGMRTKKSEVEVKRGDTIKIGDAQFLPITLKGTLTMENYRSEDANVKVRRQISGKVLEMKQGGYLEYTSVQPGDPNASNVIEWKVTIPAGGKLEMEYTYETYTLIRKG